MGSTLPAQKEPEFLIWANKKVANYTLNFYTGV